MSWYSIFYWLSVGDKVSTAAGAVSIMSGILFIIMAIAVFCGGFGESYNEDDRKLKAANLPICKKARNWSLFSFFLLGALSVLTPSKKDTILIIAGGSVGEFITSDSSARALPSDITKYLHKAIQEEMSELTNKTTDIKDMSKEQILEQVEKGNITIKKD